MRRWCIVVFLFSMATGWAQDDNRLWRDSLSVLNEAIRQNPQSTDLRLKKAAVNIEMGQLDYAIEEYGRVLELKPGNPSALYFRAYANTKLRRYQLAVNDYENLLQRIPRHFEARLGLAEVKHLMGRNVEALDEMNTVIEMYADSALAYAARAALETELKQYEPALFDWNEALQRQPDNLEFMLSKVAVLLSLKRKREARALLKEMMEKGASPASLKEWLDRC
jgi:tetratricopeptide (TPR) repeat protein